MRISGVLIATALLVSTATAAEPAGSRPQVDPSCATPDDCTLREAAAAAGVSVGFLADLDDPATRDLHLAQADAITNHGFSWNVMEPEQGTWNFGPADIPHAFAAEHGLTETGLHFAWDQDSLDDLPAWVEAITDPDELRAVLHTRAATIFDRYPDLDRIDVINEPFETLGGQLYRNHFHEVLGPDYIAELFDIVAAHAPPGTELIVNENMVEYFPAKAEALLELTRDLVARGKRIDGVGLQSHFFAGEPDWDRYRQLMEDLAALGVEPLITELDVPLESGTPDRDALQAQRYRLAVESCLAVPACTSITVWGFSDADSWINWFLGPGYEPLLWDAALERKPAWFAVRDALAAGRPVARPVEATTTVPTSAPSPTPPPTPAAAVAVPGQASYTG